MFYDKEIDILGDTGYLDENGLWVEGANEIVKTMNVTYNLIRVNLLILIMLMTKMLNIECSLTLINYCN